jgi:hypothetical protein
MKNPNDPTGNRTRLTLGDTSDPLSYIKTKKLHKKLENVLKVLSVQVVRNTSRSSESTVQYKISHSIEDVSTGYTVESVLNITEYLESSTLYNMLQKPQDILKYILKSNYFKSNVDKKNRLPVHSGTISASQLWIKY